MDHHIKTVVVTGASSGFGKGLGHAPEERRSSATRLERPGWLTRQTILKRTSV